METPSASSARLLAKRRTMTAELSNPADSELEARPAVTEDILAAVRSEVVAAMSGEFVMLSLQIDRMSEQLCKRIDSAASRREDRAPASPQMGTNGLPHPHHDGAACPSSPRRQEAPRRDEAPEGHEHRRVAFPDPPSPERRSCRQVPKEQPSVPALRGRHSGRSSEEKFSSEARWRSELNSSHTGGFPMLSSVLTRVRPRSQLEKWVWANLDHPDTATGGFWCMHLLSIAMLVNAAFPVVMTVDPQPLPPDVTLRACMVLDTVFAIEVCLRFWSCPNRVAFCICGSTTIDICAGVGAFTLWYAGPISDYDRQDVRCMVALYCAVPVLRMLKLLRRFDTFFLLLKAIRLASEALPVMLYILTVLLLVFASVIYLVEPRSNIPSLPAALWFTIVTVGTVGYGDVTPQCTEGIIVVAVLIVISALYMAVPIGIMGNAFATVWETRKHHLLVHHIRRLFWESGLCAPDIPELFCSFDDDADGSLSVQEFTNMMEALQVSLTGEQLVTVFGSFCHDASQSINDQDFVHAVFPEAFSKVYTAASVVNTEASEPLAGELEGPVPLPGCTASSSHSPSTVGVIATEPVLDSVGWPLELMLAQRSFDDNLCRTVT